MASDEAKSSPSARGWVPVPDPTTLTTDIVNQAKADLRRELANLREVIEARLEAMDEATELRLKTAADVRPQTERQIRHLEALHEEKFRSIETRFEERDVRTDLLQRAAKEALDAALAAAKELVSVQGAAFAAAAEKTELSVTKSIDQIGLRIETVVKGFDDRLTELKERIDRGDGVGLGVKEQRQQATEFRAGISQSMMVGIMAVALVVSIISVVAGIVLGGR